MYSVASPPGRTMSTASGSWWPVSQAKSVPGRNGYAVSFARTRSIPVGTTRVSPGNASASAARRLA